MLSQLIICSSYQISEIERDSSLATAAAAAAVAYRACQCSKLLHASQETMSSEGLGVATTQLNGCNNSCI